MSPARFLKKFLAVAAVLLAACCLLVFVFDPFFHYHRPWFGLKAVLSDKEYQCVGTLRNFDYDSLIVGSSVTENNNNGWYDSLFGCRAIKAVRSYGATADLCWMLDTAEENHSLRYVFYNIDPPSLWADPHTTFASSGCPMYLYDRNPLNDYKYLLNKDVLLEKIPYMILKSLQGYDENESYNWWQSKTFSEKDMLSRYERPQNIVSMQPENAKQDALDANIKLLTDQVAAHPDTQYYFFFPPYSVLWWDASIRNGERDFTVYNERSCMKALLAYPNVRVFCFQMQDSVTDLNTYMDVLHFSPEINRQMAEAMAAGKMEVTAATVDETADALKACTEKWEKEVIPLYEDRFPDP
jgi:hypothetical protein